MIRCDVAIVGGGFSGSAVAAHLANSPVDLSLVLFEEGDLGRGAAYGTRHSEHVLNTRAAAMSAFPDDPDHFVRWLGPRAAPGDFVSRRLYGDYLAEIARHAFERPRFMVVRDRVRAIARSGEGRFDLTTAAGTRYSARAVVLATGNAAPNADFLPAELVQHPGYIGDPWRFDFRSVGGRVLLVGSGLTALDALVALEANGHRGRVDVVSRHGQFPEVHAASHLEFDVEPELDARDARWLLRSFRRLEREAAQRGVDWRALVDAIRPRGESLWKRLSPRERARFDRHLRAAWERRRHRAPQQVDAVRRRYAESGRLTVHAAHVSGFGDGAVRIESADGTAATLHPDWIVNCTGPGRGKALLRDPLLASLLAGGIAAPEPLGLGIRVDDDGVAVGAGDAPVHGLWVVGSLARGSRFEATAVPELRVMAQAASAGVLERLAKNLPDENLEQGYYYMAMPVGDLNFMVATLPAVTG